MGCRNKEFTEDETCSSTLGEALLFATMCLIGLPVEVHVKDGSVYSGIFHTACVENDYGVVLKKARLTKKGKRNLNVENEVIIDTLIVLSCDLAQVVAQEVLLPADSFSKISVGDDNEAVINVPTSLLSVSDTKISSRSFKDGSHINQARDIVQTPNGLSHGSISTVPGKHSDVRQIMRNNVDNDQGDAKLKMVRLNCKELGDVAEAASCWRPDQDNQLKQEHDDQGQKIDIRKGTTVCQVDEAQSSISCVETQLNQVNSQEKKNVMPKQLLDGVSNGLAPALVKVEKQCNERPASVNTYLNAQSVGVSTSSHSTIDSSTNSRHSSMASTTDLPPSHGSEPNKNGKEFKLNPRAKLFSPSAANTMSATPATPMVASVAYISNNSPVPVAVAHPEVEFSPFVPRSSVPAKFVPYGNTVTGYGGNVAQLSQPVMGHMGTRTQQPLRYVGQYPLQTGPTYSPPNPQSVMVGRLGQLVYVHPVSHDLAQGPTVVSPVLPCPLLTTQPAQFPKHQGTAAPQALQFCVPPPFMANGNQPLAAAPNHVPILQPSFAINRPLQVPVSNAFFSAKFS